MPVTTQSYTANPTYTAANFASIFRSALIDSGHMAEWHDSFANGGVENRVLEITYDGAKTYGKTYYWFQFSGANMFMHVSTGWNTGSDIPAGVGGAGSRYLDWLSSGSTPVTNTTDNHMRFASFNAAQTVTIKRYTSGTFTVFLFVNGTTNYTLIIDRTAPLSGFVDLDKEIYVGAMWARTRAIGNVAMANFPYYPVRLRRSHLGKSLRDYTSNNEYGASSTASTPWEIWNAGTENLTSNHVYGAVGNASGSFQNHDFGRNVILLPNGFNNVNSAYATDEKPVFQNLILSPYSSLALPVVSGAGQFVVYPVYDNNTLQIGATFVVSAGVEEYEIIQCQNGSVLNDRPSIIFGARTV